MNIMQSLKFWLNREVILSAAFVFLIATPFVVFGDNEKIFVDKDNKGSENGSANHPYRSISKALKHADEGTEVRIAKGEYKENITVPKGVKLFGRKKDMSDVVIKGDDNEPTVTMKHGSELNNLTVSGGRHGVRVEERSKAKIVDVKIKKSDRDGIHVDSAPREKKYRVTIYNVEIKESKRTGIFSERRDLVIMKSDIHDNGSDGIDLALDTDAWIEDNKIHNNRGTGLKVALGDGSDVWTKSTSFRGNGREGVEVNVHTMAGQFGLKKATVAGNGRYGVAKIARNAEVLKGFGGVIIGTDVNVNRFESNQLGAISPVLSGF